MRCLGNFTEMLSALLSSNAKPTCEELIVITVTVRKLCSDVFCKHFKKKNYMDNPLA